MSVGVIMRLSVALVLVLSMFAASAALGAPKRVAVLPLENPANLSAQEVGFLTDLIRGQAMQALPTDQFIVMTQENLVAMLPPGKTLADCIGECAIQTGKNLKAHYIVTGRVIRFGKSLRFSIRAHVTATKAMLAQREAKGKAVEDFEAAIKREAPALMSKILRHAGGRVASLGTGADVSVVQEGTFEAKNDEWSPDGGGMAVLSFVSEPAGAVVTVDGAVACQPTPCSKALAVGTHEVEIILADYLPYRATYALKVKGTLKAVLRPDFGWVSVRTPAAGIPITIDGTVVGPSPIPKRRLGHGPHRVEIDDGCHYPVAQQLQVERGKTHQLTLTPKVRPSGIKVQAQDESGNDVAGAVYVDGQKLGATFATHKVPLCSKQLVVKADGLGDWSLDLTGPKLAEKSVATVVAKMSGRQAKGASSSISLASGVRPGPKAGKAAPWQTGAGALAIVEFESTPPGAAVVVDGRPLCQTTPCRKALAPGEHEVRFALVRHVTKTERVKLATGQRVKWSLEPNFGRLAVKTQPPGLALKLDGKAVGRSPYTAELTAGPYQIEVADDCYVTKGQRINLKRGDERSLVLEPKAKPAGIKVLATAKGKDVEAKVFVDGEEVGIAPGTFKVSLCAKRVEVKSSTHGVWSSNLSLEEKKTTELKAALSQGGGSAVVVRRRAPGKGGALSAKLFTAKKPTQLSEGKWIKAFKSLNRIVKVMPDTDPNKAELYYRMSEMFWERASAKDIQAFAKEEECIARAGGNRAGEDRCRNVRERATATSHKWRDKAIEVYKHIITNFPTYQKLDGVLFALAFNFQRKQKPEPAKKIYKTLLQRFPRSKKVPAALLNFGEMLFDEGDVRGAQKVYGKIVQSYQNASVYGYARYKLGWCNYNLGRYKVALGDFLSVLKYSRGRKDGGRSRLTLAKEALRDLVRTYVQLGNDPRLSKKQRKALAQPRRAVKFFRKNAPVQYKPLLAELVRLYREAGQTESADALQRVLQRL